jgi:hypothetical protein
MKDDLQEISTYSHENYHDEILPKTKFKLKEIVKKNIKFFIINVKERRSIIDR